MTRRIVMVRHGRAAADGRAYGQRCDPALAADGRGEVDDLRCRLAPTRFGLVVRSPTLRTAETAERLGTPADRVDPRWSERDLGAWEGRPWTELWEEAPAAIQTDPRAYVAFTPPEGEPVAALHARVVEALTALADPPEWQEDAGSAAAPVLVVTHGGAITAAVAHVLDLDPATALRIRVATATSTWLTHHPGGHWTLDRLAA